MGELEPRNRGLDPSGLEESDFFEDEKNLPLKTIAAAFLMLLGYGGSVQFGAVPGIDAEIVQSDIED